jgi:hypothetical protein
MNQNRYWLALVVTLALGTSVLAEAASEQRQIVVTQGHDKRFAIYINTRADCSSGPLPTITLVTPAAHGAVKIARGTFKGTNIKQCLSVEVPALVASYRAEPNFIGRDAFELEVKFPDRTETQDYNVDVLAPASSGQSL